MGVQRNLVISTGSRSRKGRSEVSSHSARPREPACPEELSSPQTGPESGPASGGGVKPGPLGKAVPSHHRHHQGGSNPKS